MYRFFSWYNQNRRKVWITIITIFIIGMIVFWLINMVNDGLKSSSEIIQENEINTNALNSITITSEKSGVSGRNANIEQKQITVLDDFISYCNDLKLEEAYKLLSDECKEEMYPEYRDFVQAYCRPVFENGKKNIEVENWIGNTFKVNYNEDYLASGKYTKESAMQDYITIVKDSEGNYKLNINKYIRRASLNKEVENGDIKVKALQRDSYMDYEYFTFEVTNNSDKKIALCDINSLDATYLKDTNELKYNGNLSELSQAELICLPRQTKTIKIKYFNQYSSTRNIKNLVFQNVILDYDSYVDAVELVNTQISIDL